MQVGLTISGRNRLSGGVETRIPSFKTLITDRRLLAFAAAVVLLHFGNNAAMLPLLGQALTAGTRGDSSIFSDGSLFMVASIIVAQVVMIPVAGWVGRKAGTWGRKPIFRT